MAKTSKELKLSMSLAEWLSLNHDVLLPLTKMGGIISCPHPLGKDYVVYMMLDEVREYFEPHVAKYIARKKEQRTWYIAINVCRCRES